MAYQFRTAIGQNIYNQKYSHEGAYTWPQLSEQLVREVLGCPETMGYITQDDIQELTQYVTDMKFIPGGRYLYYAGRPLKAYNNCYLLKGEEDTREEWGSLLKRASDCLMTGGGIGIDYSVFRSEGTHLKRTGGKASGPIPLMHSVNETGRNVMQGGSRRSAIYASLNWKHGDATSFLQMKDWHSMRIGNQLADGGMPYTVWHAKQEDFNYHAPLDMTNVSLNYDDAWLFMKNRDKDATFLQNVKQALRTGEPGFSFNFGSKENETLRNACTEVTSADDSDCCNLGSVNMSRISSIDEFRDVVSLASKFLVCGTLCGDVPYAKVADVRAKNRRLGLGLMGMHEWLLQRGYGYEVTPELHNWLWVYKEYSKRGADKLCDALHISRPVAYRAIAPTGKRNLPLH